MAESKVTLLIDAKLGPQLANIDKLGAKIRKALSISSVIEQYTELEGKLDSIAKKIGAIQGVPGGGTNQITAAHGGGRSVGSAVRATSGAGTATIFGPRGEVLSTVNTRAPTTMAGLRARGSVGAGMRSGSYYGKDNFDWDHALNQEHAQWSRRIHSAQADVKFRAEKQAQKALDKVDTTWGMGSYRPSLGRGFGAVDIPIGADGVPGTLRPQTRPAHVVTAAVTGREWGNGSAFGYTMGMRGGGRMGRGWGSRDWNSGLGLGVPSISPRMRRMGGGAALGVAGVAAGIASGDPAGMLAGAGAGLGMMLGGPIGGMIGAAGAGVVGIGMSRLMGHARTKGMPALQSLMEFSSATGLNITPGSLVEMINASRKDWQQPKRGGTPGIQMPRRKRFNAPQPGYMGMETYTPDPNLFIRTGQSLGYDATGMLDITGQAAMAAQIDLGGMRQAEQVGIYAAGLQRAFGAYGVGGATAGQMLFETMRGSPTGGAVTRKAGDRGGSTDSLKLLRYSGGHPLAGQSYNTTALRRRLEQTLSYGTQLGMTRGETAQLFKQEAMLSSTGFIQTGLRGEDVMRNLVSGGAAFGGGFRGMQMATGFRQYGQQMALSGARTPIDFLMLRSVLGSRAGTPGELASAYEEMESGKAFANREVLQRVVTQVRGQVSNTGLQKLVLNRVFQKAMPGLAVGRTMDFAGMAMGEGGIDLVSSEIKKMTSTDLLKMATGITPDEQKNAVKLQNRAMALGVSMIDTMKKFEKAADGMAAKLDQLAPLIGDIAANAAHRVDHSN